MIRNAIQHLMYGRYGHDQLNLFLMVLYLLLYLVYMLTGWELFSLCSLLLLAYTLFRLLSRDHAKRRREVPRGKGNITVNCRSCGARFEAKS